MSDEMEVLGDRIHKAMMIIVRNARSQDDVDEVYDTLMDSISDDFVIVYLGKRLELEEKEK